MDENPQFEDTSTSEVDGVSTDSGSAHEGQPESKQQSSSFQQKDYTQDFEYMKQQNQRLLSDIQAHKEELAAIRESERRRTFLLAGDKSIIKEEEEKRRAAQIRDELKKVAPEIAPFLDGKASPESQNNKVSLAETMYFNQAKEKAYGYAKNAGFATNEGQHFVSMLGELIIRSVPQWDQRFYNGDQSVLDEVNSFITEKILKPRDQAIEAKIIEKIKKQGRFTSPLPKTSGGSGMPAKLSENFDFSRQEDRMKRLSQVINRAVESSE